MEPSAAGGCHRHAGGVVGALTLRASRIMVYGKMRLRLQEKRPQNHLFRLMPQPEWKSPVLREIASIVERYLKPRSNPAYQARSRN
jgi:hypothetical protein